MKKLSLVSYLAPNMFWFYEAVGAYLSRVLNVEVDIIQSSDEALKDPLLLEDHLDIAFICGLPFIRNYRTHLGSVGDGLKLKINALLQ